jgi:hypothetical protein
MIRKIFVSLLLLLSCGFDAQAEEALRTGDTYTKSALLKGINTYLGVNTSVSQNAAKISLAGKRIEIWTADASCGFQMCQYFIVENVEGKYKLLGDFFGRYKVLEASDNGFRHLEVSSNVAGETSTYILHFNGESFARK